jgi:hypothetical protein
MGRGREVGYVNVAPRPAEEPTTAKPPRNGRKAVAA